MTIALRSASTFTAHAVCAAAGVRDGLRTAQFYVRDMANADGLQSASTHTPTFLSRFVGMWARGVDWFLSKAADISVGLLVPKWRELPSPFAPGMRAEVMEAIRQNRLVRTSLFTAYFFRAARHILNRCTYAPHLILEHRIDAARRIMEETAVVAATTPEETLANVLINLVESDAVARVGEPKPGYAFMQQAGANIAVMSTACLALLLAEDGKPIENLDEDEFFAIAGALIAPRLPAMAEAIAARDVKVLAEQLVAVKNLY
jgi:hypothetical protein